jgi:hypothetical protein
MHVIERTGKAQWIPVKEDCCLTIIPSAVHDRPTPVGVDGEDWFGCKWYFLSDVRGYTMNPAESPLKDITRWTEDVKFPNLDNYDWENSAKTDLKDFNRDEKILSVFQESGPFERLHQLMGFGEAFLAMYEQPDEFLELMDAITDFKVELAKKICEYYKPDLLMTMDDLGCNLGPLLSLDMYREFIKPFDKRVIQAIHEGGAKALYHSCGKMQDFTGDLIEIGADILHPFQGGINDQSAIQKKYGDKVLFEDCLDNAVIHDPKATEAQLRCEIRRVIDVFGSKRNYVMNTSALTKERQQILVDEARTYGRTFYSES